MDTYEVAYRTGGTRTFQATGLVDAFQRVNRITRQNVLYVRKVG